MPFVKLDCGMLDSTIWTDREAREVFVTALLMAVPRELSKSEPQLAVRSLEETGFVVPAGWYGFVEAAGTGIARRAGMQPDHGLDALERLGSPDPESRCPDFDGRRLVRVDHGYVVLNYMKYRDHDYTNADRQRRWRARKGIGQPASASVSRNVTTKNNAVTVTAVTQADAEGRKQKTDSKRTTLSPSGTAGAVFSHYLNLGHRAAWTPKRERLIKSRLDEGFSVDDLKTALTGFHGSTFHRGENDRQTVYLDLELLLRDAKHVEEGLSLARDKPATAAAPALTMGGRPIKLVNGEPVYLDETNP